MMRAWSFWIPFMAGIFSFQLLNAAENLESEELKQIQAQQQMVIKSLNQNNPLSADYSRNPAAVASVLPNGMPNPLAAVEKGLSSPPIQVFLKIVSDPNISKGIIQIAQSPERKNIGYAEIAWFFIFMILKAWWGAKLIGRNWCIGLLSRLIGILLYFGVAIVGIPAAFMGQSYLNLILQIVDTILKAVSS